jgi:hypothetical protein
MTMENEFYGTFNLKSNREILDIYKDRSRYVPDAQDAIIDILKKRDLYQEALEKEKKEEIEYERFVTKAIQNFEMKALGNDYYSSNIDFARNSLRGNEYFSADFSDSKKNGWGVIALLTGTLGITSLVVFFMMNRYDTDLILYWALPSLLASLFLIIGIKGHRASKSTVRLLKNGEKHIDFEIQTKDGRVTVNSPFQHEYYWTYIDQGGDINQVNLFILIYKDHELLISLNQTLDATKKPPPHWNYVSRENTKKESKFFFTNYGFQSSNLYKLQKILDGIKEQYQS